MVQQNLTCTYINTHEISSFTHTHTQKMTSNKTPKDIKRQCFDRLAEGKEEEDLCKCVVPNAWVMVHSGSGLGHNICDGAGDGGGGNMDVRIPCVRVCG